jgi:hypothetical protein
VPLRTVRLFDETLYSVVCTAVRGQAVHVYGAVAYSRAEYIRVADAAVVDLIEGTGVLAGIYPAL